MSIFFQIKGYIGLIRVIWMKNISKVIKIIPIVRTNDSDNL
jgi:hypothetical protein